jgi:hypothetical protein
VFVSSSNNRFWHNTFLDNSQQVLAQTVENANVWDDGYEGNYWSDYNGTDSDGDGIGDISYVIDASNQDNYPLMNPHWNPADVNHDLKIDVKDVYLCSKAFGSLQGDPKWNPIYDMNDNGRIDLKDIWLICRDFGKTYL